MDTNIHLYIYIYISTCNLYTLMTYCTCLMLYVQNVHVNVYLCTYKIKCVCHGMSVCPYSCMPLIMNVWLFPCVPVCLSVCLLPVRRLSVCLSVPPSVRPSVCLCLSVSVCVCLCLSVCLSACMPATCMLDVYMDLAHHSNPLRAFFVTKLIQPKNEQALLLNDKTYQRKKLPSPQLT